MYNHHWEPTEAFPGAYIWFKSKISYLNENKFFRFDFPGIPIYVIFITTVIIWPARQNLVTNVLLRVDIFNPDQTASKERLLGQIKAKKI